MKKIDISNNFDNDANIGCTMQVGNNNVLLWMKLKPRYTTSDYGCLVHEIFHCCSFILSRAGLKLGRKSEEAYAYLIGHVTELITEKILQEK